MTEAVVGTGRRPILAFACLVVSFLVAVAWPARAETLEAPVGGAPVTLGDGRVACNRSGPGGWTIDASGRTVRPPAVASAIGTVVELRVARAASACAQDSATIRLATTGPWPNIDAGGFTLAVDEGRLRGRGRGLSGVTVSWPSEQGLGIDVCRDPKTDGGSESCAWSVAKTISAAPSGSALRWWPAGAQAAIDAVLFAADGKRVDAESFSIVPSRVELMDILPPGASVDVSAGVGRVALSHPEAVSGVECATTRCTVESDALLVQAPPASVVAVDVKVRLVPHVFYVRKAPPDVQPILHVSILRCPMAVASGPPLRGVDGVRAVVRLEGVCMRDVASLGFLEGSQRVDVAQIVTTEDASYAVLELGTVRAPEIVLMAVRGDVEGTVVAMARTETRQAPNLHATLEIGGFPPIDFIPNNRRAIVHLPHVSGADVVLVPVTDVYDATTDHGVTTVQGDVNAVGLVALQFGYRVPTLPHPLDGVNLAVLTDALQRGVKEANIPAPFGLTANTAEPLAEVLCSDERGVIHKIVPGVVLHMPFAARHGCRVVLHRDRLSPEYGTQKLTLEIEVDKVDGTARPEAHVTQTLVLRAGGEARVAWIKGVVAPYDRVVVRLSHLADEAHYLGALDIATGEPAVQWSSVFGTGRVRIYATTAIPTGLYRFGTTNASGVLSLSLGVLSRFTWLDSEGHEGLLGAEAGLMAFGLTGDLSASSQPLTQVGAVAGLGLSIPIANAGSPTQASINLHAWFEQRIAGSGAERNSQQAVIFGPSISLGNVGTTF
jgi:hypothetical protein